MAKDIVSMKRLMDKLFVSEDFSFPKGFVSDKPYKIIIDCYRSHIIYITPKTAKMPWNHANKPFEPILPYDNLGTLA